MWKPFFSQVLRRRTNRRCVVHSSLLPQKSLRAAVGSENMTTLQQRAQQSGLVFANHVSQWNVNDWPPLLGGAREGHASVVLDDPKQDDRAQTVVVLGGDKHSQIYKSVLLLNLPEENKQWREGPPLHNNRTLHAAVVCNGGVYVIGGHNGSSPLDTIERIGVENLLAGSSVRTTSNQWATLNCRLSTRRERCSVVSVCNRYMVVIGGCGEDCLESVDIIDTVLPSNHTVISGPSMTVPRHGCASAVIGNRIFVVGGFANGTALKSVEYLEFHDPSGNETKNTTNNVFPCSCRWTSHNELELFFSRDGYEVVAVGSCLIVMGVSWDATNGEVLDTCRNTVWTIPRSTGSRYGCSAVVHSKGIAMIGGSHNASCETLSLIDKNTWCFRRLMELAPSTIFGSRTNSLGLASDCAKELKEPNERPKKKLATGKSATEKVS